MRGPPPGPEASINVRTGRIGGETRGRPDMNHYATEQLVKARMQERLHEAEQERLARMARRTPAREPTPAADRIRFRAVRRLVARLAPAT